MLSDYPPFNPRVCTVVNSQMFGGGIKNTVLDEIAAHFTDGVFADRVS